MMGLGWQELFIVLIIIVIIFGAGKIPEVGSALGKGIRDFKAEAGEKEEPAPIAASTDVHDGRMAERRELRADQI